MRREKYGLLTDLLLKRARLVELILVAIILTFGVNLAANSFTSIGISVGKLLIGIALCVVAVLILLISLFKIDRKKISIEGFIIYDEK